MGSIFPPAICPALVYHDRSTRHCSGHCPPFVKLNNMPLDGTLQNSNEKVWIFFHHLYLYKIESLNLTQLRDAISAVRYVVEKKLIYPWIWWFMEMDLKCIWHTWSHYCSNYEGSTQRRFRWFVLSTPFAICRIFPWFMKYSFCLKVSFVFNTKNLYWGNI